MSIIKDDGTWEPAPSGYTTGDKAAWRDRMYAKCPKPEIGQIVIDYTMNGMRVGYKALDANGYNTRWQRVAAQDQDAINQQYWDEYQQYAQDAVNHQQYDQEFYNQQSWEEYCHNEYHYFVDELKKVSPNPTTGEVCIIDNTWDYPANASASQFRAFQYSLGVWNEIGLTGRFMPIFKSAEENASVSSQKCDNIPF